MSFDASRNELKIQQRIAKASEDQAKALFRIARAIEKLSVKNDDDETTSLVGKNVRILVAPYEGDIAYVSEDANGELKVQIDATGYIGWFKHSEVEEV